MRARLLKAAAAACVIGGLAAAAPGGAPTPGQTASGALDVIAVRQAGYDLMGGNVAAMKSAVAAKQDPAPYADAADAMAAWGRAIPSLFPPGSDKGHDTKARAEIWTDRAGFEKAAADFVAAAERLSEVAKSGDAAAFAVQFKAAGAACGACHRAYKVRDS